MDFNKGTGVVPLPHNPRQDHVVRSNARSPPLMSPTTHGQGKETLN